MERDQHSTPGPGAGRVGGDPDRDLDRRRPEVAPDPEAPAAASEAQDAPPAPAEPSPPETQADERTDVIMSKLPRTRPQRATGRRQRASSPKSRPAQRAASARPKTSRAAASGRAGNQRKRATTAARATPAATARPARARPAPAKPVARTSSPRRTTAPRSRASEAPGLPRLALDGAVEAAKLPLKVSGRLTLRALDAVARGLRGG